MPTRYCKTLTASLTYGEDDTWYLFVTLELHRSLGNSLRKCMFQLQQERWRALGLVLVKVQWLCSGICSSETDVRQSLQEYTVAALLSRSSSIGASISLNVVAPFVWLPFDSVRRENLVQTIEVCKWTKQLVAQVTGDLYGEQIYLMWDLTANDASLRRYSWVVFVIWVSSGLYVFDRSVSRILISD